MKDDHDVTVSSGSEIQLKRVAGFWSLVFFGIVFMNPTGALAMLGYTQIVSQGHSLLVFLTGTIVVFFTCKSYTKMVRVFPNSGSAYTYTSKGLNSKVGFLVGWTMLLSYVLIPMFIFTLTSLYLNRVFPFFSSAVWMIIITAAVLAVSIIGLKLSDILNTCATFIQFAVAIVFAALATVYLVSHGTALGYSAVVFNPPTFTLTGMLMASTLAVLSFLGFDGITTITEESTIPPEKVAKAIVVAVLLQGIILCGLAYISSLLFPDYLKISNPDTISYDLQTLVGGPTYNFVVIMVTQFLTLMATSTAVTAASRLLYAMGRDGVIPKRVFGHLGKKYSTPTWNVIIIIVLCLIGGLIFEWSLIASLVSFGAMFGFACVNLAVIRHFFFVKKERKIFGNLILPFVGFALILYVMLSTATICKIVGFSWLACGIVYLAIRWSCSEKFRETIDRGMDVN